jgi:hypothetical protein
MSLFSGGVLTIGLIALVAGRVPFAIPGQTWTQGEARQVGTVWSVVGATFAIWGLLGGVMLGIDRETRAANPFFGALVGILGAHDPGVGARRRTADPARDLHQASAATARQCWPEAGIAPSLVRNWLSAAPRGLDMRGQPRMRGRCYLQAVGAQRNLNKNPLTKNEQVRRRGQRTLAPPSSTASPLIRRSNS